MNGIRYAPAPGETWLAIAGPCRLLLLDQQKTAKKLDELWESVGSSGGVQSILDELTRGGISNVPSFALASWSPHLYSKRGPLSIIVRGGIRAVVFSETELSELDGNGVSTWNERVVPDAVGAEIFVDQANEKGGVSGSMLRLESGMAWARHIQIGAPHKDEAKRPVQVPEPEHQPTEYDAPSETTKTEFTVPVVSHTERPVDTPGSSIGDGYDYLFGETIARTVEDAAVRGAGDMGSNEVGPTSGAESPDLDEDGDHDGKTAISLDRATRQAARRAREQKLANPIFPSSPRLYIDLSSGTSEELNQPVLIGRAPSVNKVSGGNLPRLVTITGSDQDISRNHVQVAVEGGTVIVTDLHSRNGTMVVHPGRPPQQLRAGEPTAVIVGTVVNLGAGVTFTVREG